MAPNTNVVAKLVEQLADVNARLLNERGPVNLAGDEATLKRHTEWFIQHNPNLLDASTDQLRELITGAQRLLDRLNEDQRARADGEPAAGITRRSRA